MLMSKPSAYDHVMTRPPPHPVSNQSLYQTGSKVGGHSKQGYSSNLNNNSVLGNNSSLNYYPHLLQPTRMSGLLGGGSSNSSSNRAPSTRTSLKNSASQAVAKNVSFYRSGDVHMQAFRVAITRRHFRTFDALLESLSDRIPLPFGVRTISTPHGTHGINKLEEFEDGKAYVCSDKKTVKPLNLSAVQHPKPPWFISKPKTRTKAVAQLIRRPDADTLRVPLRLTQVKTPKKIVIVRNGEPNFRHSLLLSRRTPQSFENIMDDVGEIFRMRVHKMYTTDGRKVESLQALFLGPNVYVAAGREAFQPMEYRLKRVALSQDKKGTSIVDLQNLNKERTPKELKKTKGRWRVAVVTSELPAAATDARVNITVYGVKGNSGPILLNDGNDATFKSGNEDEFAINVGAIGEIRKVRIAHDNTGKSPGWLCESLTMTDVTTEDILHFSCNRWLSRDEDDGEICRELPANLVDKASLSKTSYVVAITTGNLWNSGTSANVHLTLFGDMGDSGPRLLQRGGKAEPQIKGTTSVYKMEAVSLGLLHRIVVGHDGMDKGEGWFLERIVVKEDQTGAEEWIFPCDRWLDVGEGDGRVVRELFAENSSKTSTLTRGRSQPDKQKVNALWELEKWKFQRGNHVVLISQATERALRIRPDAGIDGLGDPSLPTSTFEISRRRGNIRVFSNVGQTSFHIALDQNRMLGHGKGGTFCEFQVKVQPDRTVLLESVKHPGQHATVDPGGKPADTRGHPNAPGKIFYVYVKGCFRHNSVILLNTSPTQALAITSVGDVIGTGRRVDDVTLTSPSDEKQHAYFRVVKVAEGVRMFQCDKDPKKFLRIKDGRCDGWGNGDAYCHFKVHKYRLGGYITLQSMKHKGVFIGLNTNGKARPTVDTGDVNTRFFPEVISFGERRKERAEAWRSPEPSFVTSSHDGPKEGSETFRSSPTKLSVTNVVTLQNREKSNTGPVDGDFRIYVTTGNSGTTESIGMHVYGDKKCSGSITLGKGVEGGVFQCGQTDEFQANLASVGEIRKIRIGVEEMTSESSWRLKQVKMKDMISNQIYRFKFNRWMSRTKDDGATLRELPVANQDGNTTLPMLRYFVLVRTSKESARLKLSKNNPSGPETQHEIYLCIHGENGDTGRRFLLRKLVEDSESPDRAQKALFAPGQVDKFEIEAVSLGELTKCVFSCPTSPNASSNTSLAWLCDDIVVRESEGATQEYLFQGNGKWLSTRKVGAKTQLKLELTEKREVKVRSDEENNEFKEGDWKVSITTGSDNECATSSNVMLYACGEKDTSSGPILLGSGAKGLFAPNTTEHFKVNLSGIINLQKIRLSHDNTGKYPSWFVERVQLKCATSDEAYTLNARKWLSDAREPYRMFLEIPIPKPGEELAKVLRYQVVVYTGNILGSDTDAHVFITIYGKKGDTGRRPLLKSLNNAVTFQESQVDIFEVEAVDLGELTKIEVGHDGVGHGNGWFLHKIIIKESQLAPRDYIFFCNKWLDDGQDDGKIVRIIHAEPLDEDEVKQVYNSAEGRYDVIFTTGNESSRKPCPENASVTMVIYGKEGKTGEIRLKPDLETDAGTEIFRPGQTDTFQIEVAEVGEIYKIRLSLNDESDWRGLFIETIVLEDSLSKERIVFNCNRWLSKFYDDQETIREFAVARNDDPLPVNLYFVSITTGDRPAAGTDANVYVTLRGERGDCGRRELTRVQGDAFPFQRNSTSSFIIEAVDLGKIHEVLLSHNGHGEGAGWFVEKVSVRENEFDMVEWVFPGHVWLDDYVGDCKTTRKLRLLGSFDVINGDEELAKLTSPPSREVDEATSKLYDVEVTVDEVMAQGNGMAKLKGVLYGGRGVTEEFSLGDWRPGGEKSFTGRIDAGAIGEVKKIRVEMEDSPLNMNVLLLSVKLYAVSSLEVLNFNFDRRFRTENGSTIKELPSLRGYNPSQQMVTYLISIDMSPSNEDVPSRGSLRLRLRGANEDSGFRTLFRGMNGFSASKRLNCYLFEHESVDLTQLTDVTLSYVTEDDTNDDGGWNVREVVIRCHSPSNSYARNNPAEDLYRAKVDHTFGKKSESKICPLEQCSPELEINKRFPSVPGTNLKQPTPVQSEGLWRIFITTSAFEEESISNQISIRLFGVHGPSDVISVSTPDVHVDDIIDRKAVQRQIRTQDLKLGTALGDLYHLRVALSKDTMIRVFKIKLKDLITSQEFLVHLSAKERMNTRENEDGIIVYDLPLMRPDEEPPKHHKYEVQVKTGNALSSSTDADVTINISGTDGETGPRSLRGLVKDSDSILHLGQTDNFAIETVDVGEPRKVTIGHSAQGGGAGWFLDDVTISETRDHVQSDFMFPCHKWLDDSVDDKLTQRELHISATRVRQPDCDLQASKGTWKFHVHAKPDVIKQRELDLKFTLCLTGRRSCEFKGHVSNVHHVIDVHVDDDEPPSPSTGEVTSQLVKLRAEVENVTDDVTRKTWPLEECWMVDTETGEKIRFVFDSALVWEGSNRGCLREVPVVRSSGLHLPVIDYYVIFYTNVQSDRDFSPAQVTCQLQGKYGDTGWRNILQNTNASGKVHPGRVDVFPIEAVSLGDVIDRISVDVTGSADKTWTLDRVKVKRGYYDEEEFIFECGREISEGHPAELSLSKTATVYPPKPVVTQTKPNPKTGHHQTDHTVKLIWTGLHSLTKSDPQLKASSSVLPSVSLQLCGSKGASHLTAVNLAEAKVGKTGKHTSKLEVSVSSHLFGDLVKIGLGVLEPAPSMQVSETKCILHKVSLRNKVTNQYYSFLPRHSFFEHESGKPQTGFNWLELAATRPRQDPSTVATACDYVITTRTGEPDDAGTSAHVYVTLIGDDGDSGKRWLMTSSSGSEDVHNPGQSDDFVISGFYLGNLKQIVIGHDGRDVTSGWLLNDVTVTSSVASNKQFVFVCKKRLANLEEETFIERTLNLDHVMDLDDDVTNKPATSSD